MTNNNLSTQTPSTSHCSKPPRSSANTIEWLSLRPLKPLVPIVPDLTPPCTGQEPFLDGTMETPTGQVFQIKTRLSAVDILGTVLVRLGIGRNSYTLPPGLYAVGRPHDCSPILVTANYKLTFDTLRRELSGLNVWVLVLNTKGVNVWCAAGKGTFSTEEVIRRVKAVSLDQIVTHRELILPQLGATGVAALDVVRGCGFKVVYGPIRARDVSRFLAADNQATTNMRRVTFTLPERLVLAPLEVSMVVKLGWWLIPLMLLVSGIGPGIFSVASAWQRGLWSLAALGIGIIMGAVVTPVLLPWIPGRAFAAKGAILGAIPGLALAVAPLSDLSSLSLWAIGLFMMVISSWLAMNFTGATPFTSPSGVEKEMRLAMPLQATGLLASVGLWITAAFV